MDEFEKEDEAMIAEQDHEVTDIKRENFIRKKVLMGQMPMLDDDEEEDIYNEEYIPQTEFTSVSNADYAPLMCNDFVSEFIDRPHGNC